MKRKFFASLSTFITIFLVGCSPVTELGKAHQEVINSVIAETQAIGLGSGVAEKDCAVPFDCSANDQFHSTITLTGTDLTDQVVCERLFELGKKLGLTHWRRDYHEIEESGLDQKDLKQGIQPCVESIGVNSEKGAEGQSEGVSVAGYALSENNTKVGLSIQINSVSEPEWSSDFERGYFVLIATRTDWP